MANSIEKETEDLVNSFIEGVKGGNFDVYLAEVVHALKARLQELPSDMKIKAGVSTTTPTGSKLPTPPKFRLTPGGRYELAKMKSGRYDGAIVKFIEEFPDGRVRVQVIDGCTEEQKGKKLIVPRSAVRKTNS